MGTTSTGPHAMPEGAGRGAGHGHQPARAAPSGLFPTGPPRPTYREPYPVRPVPVLAGLAGGGAWLALFTLLGQDLRGHVWWTVAAGTVAWAAALALTRHGDRGVAVGVAVAVGVGWAAAASAVTLYWSVTGDWPLW